MGAGSASVGCARRLMAVSASAMTCGSIIGLTEGGKVENSYFGQLIRDAADPKGKTCAVMLDGRIQSKLM